MDRQPIAITPDETSTEQVVEGGTLTNIIEQPKKTAMLSVFPYTMDSFQGEMYFENRFEISANTTGPLFYYDPGRHLLRDDIAKVMIPYQLLPVMCHTYYDFDLEKTFVAIKHERARGKIMFCWYPGITTRSEAGYSTDFTTISVDMPDFGTQRSKCQRWIWDIEQTDTFTINLKGFKNTAWRSRNRLTNYRANPPPSDAPAIYTIYGDNVPYQSYCFGLLAVNIIMPYWPGNVAPDTLDILMFNRLMNEKYLEYRQLQGVTQIAIQTDGSTTNN